MDKIKTVILYSDGVSYNEYLSLKYNFNILNNWNLIVLNSSDIYNIYKFIPGQNLYSFKEKYSDLVFNYKNTERVYNGNFDFIFDNQFLKFQFNGILNEIDKSRMLEFSFSFLIDQIIPDLVIFGHDAFTVERVLVNACKLRGISTIGLLHSGLGFKYGLRGIVGDVSHILVWNYVDKKFLIDFEISCERLFVIGSLRFEDKYKNYSKALSKSLLAPLKKRRNVLILTAAINSGLSAPIADQKKHLNLILELIELIKRRHDLVFTIKPHPSYDHFELYRQLRNLGLRNLIFDENLNLDDAVKSADVCLMLNYFTTAAIDAIFQNIPIIFFNNAVFPLDNWIINDINGHIEKVDNIESLENLIDCLFSDRELRNKFLIRNSKLLVDILGDSKSNSSQNFSSFIEKVIDPIIISNRSKFSISPLKISDNCVLNLAYFYVYGMDLNISFLNLIGFKFFRLDSKLGSFHFFAFLKFYFIGSNSTQSKEAFKSLCYLVVLFFYNIDLVFKGKHFSNKLFIRFLILQIKKSI